jgi:hypothetical protein
MPVNPDSLLAAIIERHRHLYPEIAVCIGIVVLASCVVVGAHALIDCFQ